MQQQLLLVDAFTSLALLLEGSSGRPENSRSAVVSRRVDRGQRNAPEIRASEETRADPDLPGGRREARPPLIAD
jgi:hypothetical protein